MGAHGRHGLPAIRPVRRDGSAAAAAVGDAVVVFDPFHVI